MAARQQTRPPACNRHLQAHREKGPGRASRGHTAGDCALPPGPSLRRGFRRPEADGTLDRNSWELPGTKGTATCVPNALLHVLGTINLAVGTRWGHEEQRPREQPGPAVTKESWILEAGVAEEGWEHIPCHHEQRPGWASWGHSRELGHVKPRHTDMPLFREGYFIRPGLPQRQPQLCTVLGMPPPNGTHHDGGTRARRLAAALNSRFKHGCRPSVKPCEDGDQV